MSDRAAILPANFHSEPELAVTSHDLRREHRITHAVRHQRKLARDGDLKICYNQALKQILETDLIELLQGV